MRELIFAGVWSFSMFVFGSIATECFIRILIKDSTYTTEDIETALRPGPLGFIFIGSRRLARKLIWKFL